jgi:hypothetical protein
MQQTENDSWVTFLKPSLRIVVATGIFAALHSAFASHTSKRAAERLIGKRNRDGLYRSFFIGQSLASFAALSCFIRGQRGKTLYHVKGSSAWPLRGAQIASFSMATLAAREVGLRRMSGLESFVQWRQTGEVQPEPEAQGPSEEQGHLRIRGPFKWSRHPLNFWPLAILWLNPRMTTNLLAFNVAASLYLAVGSIHEEARLKKAYGQKYIDYQHSNVPFYLPFTRRLSRAGRILAARRESDDQPKHVCVTRRIEHRPADDRC